MILSTNQLECIYNYFHNNLRILFFVLNKDNTIIQANRFALDLLGKNIVGNDFNDYIVDFQETFTTDKYIASKADYNLLHLNIPGSLPRSYLFSFYSADDNVLVFGQNDAEEQEHLRTELLRSNQELANTTRTLHKTNAQLNKLNILKNQFLGMAAHDIRHPLTTIKMYTDFLQSEVSPQLNTVHQEFLEHIKDSAMVMEAILDDFLDYSVLESGHISLKKNIVNITDLVEKIITYSRKTASYRSVEILYKNNIDDSFISVDQSKIEQVIYNLLNNALKHSAPGDNIHVSVIGEKSSVTITVKDEGPGIDKKHLPLLFTPYKRLPAQQQASEKSSGLGLAIVGKIIDAHDGRIKIDSELGEGATFSVELPRVSKRRH